MGCPDWPKCFGQYIPPTSEDQLPRGYQDRYTEKRVEKNLRLASMMSALGWEELAVQVVNDPSIQESHDYDVWTAWIEYINRLIGVVIGLLILIYVYYALFLWKTNRSVTVISIAGLVLVLFQGWVGSLVVSTNLLPGFISFHMGLALLLVGLLVHTYFLTGERSRSVGSKNLRWVATSLFVLLIIQIFMGTGVREVIDRLLAQGMGRDQLMPNMELVFFVHRSFSLLILAIALYGLWLIWKNKAHKTPVGKMYLGVVALLVLEIVGGAIMAYFDVPKMIQPMHLLASAMLFGLLYYLVLQTNFKVATS